MNAPPKCYTTEQVLALLQMKISTFVMLKRTRKLPFLEELKPRLGKRARYRADLVDRYLAGAWGQPRAFSSHRRTA